MESILGKSETGRSVGVVLTVGSLAVCMLVLLGCPEVQEAVPSQLRGTWVAESELYKGRVMEIGRHEITFDSGIGEVSTHPVVGVLAERLEDTTRFALDYGMDNGGEYRLHLIVDHTNGQLRWAGRQQMVWNRVESG